MPLLITVTLLALCAIEGLAYGWMHPSPTGQDQPILVWQHPRRILPPAALSPAGEPAVAAATLIPLPDLYAKAAPMLRCSDGQVFLATPDDTLSLYLAFFEWNHTDTGSVLEAFRHLPEACMGSIGMKLVATKPPKSVLIDGVPLTFDHTVFQDSGAAGEPGFPVPQIHAFRAIWVSDIAGADARQGVMGTPLEQLRSLRLQCALTRYRPAYARVIQGAVRGASGAAAA
ncbi:MAG: hypothetical protein RLZZ522_647, partial [Verrucomicrobiota bacterium]